MKEAVATELMAAEETAVKLRHDNAQLVDDKADLQTRLDAALAQLAVYAERKASPERAAESGYPTPRNEPNGFNLDHQFAVISSDDFPQSSARSGLDDDDRPGVSSSMHAPKDGSRTPTLQTQKRPAMPARAATVQEDGWWA